MTEGLLPPFKIIPPAIPSGDTYLFTTDSGVEYEVCFGRQQNDILHVMIAFGVLNDEYEGEEYAETNKGEVYRVMSTLVKIVRMYMAEHPSVHTYQFTGIAKKGEPDEGATARVELYKRYFPVIFPKSEGWKYYIHGNHIVITKKNLQR
jgi:hypothetical protein